MTEQPVFDRYEILSVLGKGGMATVYRAIDTRFNRDVAIKVMPREFMHDSSFFQRFEREAQIVAALEHPAIVPVHDFGEYEGQPFLVMGYMSGGSLNDRIRRGSLDLEEAARIVDRVAEALDWAHSEGIIHRDIKPANILFDRHGYAYLADFGIVKLSEATAQLTGSGIIGTPAYMAPEMMDKGGLTHLIDIYALSVTLYQMLSGKPPYESDTPMGVLMAHMGKPIPDIRQVQPDLPGGVQAVIKQGMAKAPMDRYQSAGALAAALRESIRDGGPSAVPVPEPIVLEPITSTDAPTMDVGERTPPSEMPIGPSQQLTPKVARRSSLPWAWIGGIGAVVIIGIIGLFALMRNGRTEAPTAVENTPAPTGEPITGEAVEEPPSVAEVTDEPVVSRYVEGEILFEDDFESGETSEWTYDYASYWSLVQDETGNTVLQGIGGADWTQALVGEIAWENYIFEARVRIVERADTARYTESFSFLFRTTVIDHYRLNFNRYGLTLGQVHGIDQWRQVAFSDAFNLSTNQWMSVRIEAAGDTIRVSIDDAEYIESLDDAPLTHGQMGFGVQQTSTVWFDDVRVVELIPEEG